MGTFYLTALDGAAVTSGLAEPAVQRNGGVRRAHHCPRDPQEII